MLKIIQDISSTRYYGVVTDTPSWSLVIPPMYEQIFPHPPGFSCRHPKKDLWDAYSLDGTLILRDCQNILFLDNDYILFSMPNNKCYVVNYMKGKVVGNMHFESALIFIGNATEATEFDSSTDIFDIIVHTDYSTVGAHIEDWLCVKVNGSWGILDVANNTIKESFTHKGFTHKLGKDITEIF